MGSCVLRDHNFMLCVYVSGELSVQGQRPAGDQQSGQVHCWFHGCRAICSGVGAAGGQPLSVHPQQAHLQTETLSGTLHCALPTTICTSATSSSPNRNTFRYVALCFAYHYLYIRNKLISKQKHFQVRCIVLCLPLSVHPQQAHLQTETLPGMLHCVFISLEVQCYAIIIACVANSEAVMPPQ